MKISLAFVLSAALVMGSSALADPTPTFTYVLGASCNAASYTANTIRPATQTMGGLTCVGGILVLGAGTASIGSVIPLRGTTTDRSVVITLGGTSQQLAASNTSRNRLLIQNPISATAEGLGATETCAVNFGSAATQAGGNSFDIGPGGSFDSGGGPVMTDAVNIICPTTGHKIPAKEW